MNNLNSKFMKLLILSMLIYNFFIPVFSEEQKKDDFEKIKIMKIEYLNKKLICVNNSQNIMQLKKCWKKRKQKIN